MFSVFTKTCLKFEHKATNGNSENQGHFTLYNWKGSQISTHYHEGEEVTVDPSSPEGVKDKVQAEHVCTS